jgi:SNF2 family DNA or RNA helicase
MGTWHSLNFFKQYFTTHPQRVQTVIRVEDRFRKMSISAPPIYNSTIICRAPRHAALVNELVSPEIQMALNADDMETVFTHLGINKTTTDSLLEAVTCMQQKELQRLKSILLFKSSLDYSTPQAKEEAIKTLEAKITKITDQINTLRKRMNENKVCYICFEDISGKEMVVPCCHNVFCPKCILTSMTYRPTCPFCRANINPSALTYIGSGIQLAAVDDGPVLLTKTEQLLHLLVSQPDSKFIVFSRYDNPFLSIKNKLEEHNISVTIVNGNKDHIHNIQMKFRDGEFRVLLLNSTNFCSGMNLESATHVILYHSGMSYTEEEQVIGRAYRMGRTMPLHVVRLMNEGE